MCTYRESGAHVAITCPLCGANVIQVNGCQPDPIRTVSVVECGSCRRQYTVTVRLERLPRNPDAADRKRDERARVKATA